MDKVYEKAYKYYEEAVRSNSALGELDTQLIQQGTEETGAETDEERESVKQAFADALSHTDNSLCDQCGVIENTYDLRWAGDHEDEWEERGLEEYDALCYSCYTNHTSIRKPLQQD